MEDRIYVFIIGTAGCGKTYFTKAFSEYLDMKRVDHIIVNLDPGAESIPYHADVDVREWIRLDSIMERYGVGPNGAQIISADLIAGKVEDVKDEIMLYSADYVLIDTPGQMELFTLRASSELIIQSFGRNNCVSVFLFDPVISQRASGFTSLVFMFSSASMKLNIPQIPVLSKSDLLPEHEIEKIVRWSKDPDFLYDGLSVERGISRDLFHMLRDSGFIREVIPVSSVTGFGMDDVYEIIQDIYYSGEDIERIKY